MTQYQYGILNRNSPMIRVLTLEPGCGDSEIKCNLNKASLLDDKLYFEALSYVWGDANHRQSIRLDGFRHSVTANLEVALRHLRYREKTRTLWVDALCINQEDLSERCDQVQKMTSIYRRANAVISWTGESSEDSDEALEFLRSFGSWVKDEMGEGEHERPDAILQGRFDYIESTGFPMSNQNWPALWSFFERPYWSRVWIIQELAVRDMYMDSPDIIICGHVNISRTSWSFACTIVLALIRHGNRSRPDADELDKVNGIVDIQGLPMGFAMFNTIHNCHLGELSSMKTLLRATKQFEATDPRDKIYALLELAVEKDRFVKPDYTRPVQKVIQDLLKMMILESGDLDCLLSKRSDINSVGPSWLPELSSQMRGDIPMNSRNCPYKASANIPAKVEFIADDEIIIAKGILVGAIDEIVGPLENSETISKPGISMPSVLSKDRSFKDMISRASRLHNVEAETFWRALVLDMDPSTDPYTCPAPRQFGNMYRVWFGQESPPENFMAQSDYETRVALYTEPFRARVNSAITNHNFFTTTSGYMGTASSFSALNDVVVVLYGSPWCFVLRPIGEQYLLVGGAYVQGVMHGELIKGSKDSDVQAFTII